MDKERKTATIIDIAVPADRNIADKEEEKITKYQDLRIEVSRLWKTKTKVIPIVVGALGSIPKDLKNRLNELETKGVESKMLQKAALLGTARILRRAMAL